MSLTATEYLEKMLEQVDDKWQKTIGYPMYDILAAFSVSLADEEECLEEVQNLLDPGNLSGDERQLTLQQRSH